MKKGLGELPVGLFMMLLGLALTSGMMGISNVGAQEAVKPVSDLSKLVETKTQNQVFHNNFLTSAAELSFQNSTQEVTDREGELSWTGADFYNYDPSYEQNCNSIYCFSLSLSGGGGRVDSFVSSIEDHANSSFQRYDFSLEGRCTVVNPQFQLEVDQWSDEIYSNIESMSGTAIVRCENSNVKTQHEYSSYYVSIEPEDNRFYRLFKDTNDFFHDLFDSWNSDVQDEYTAESGTYCGSVPSDVKDSTEEQAVNDANSDVTQAWNDVKDDYPTVDGFMIRRNDLRSYTFTLDRLEHTKKYIGEGDSYTEQVGTCPCSGKNCNPPPKKKAVTDVTPLEASVNWTLVDVEEKVPLPDGWENLEFYVEPYTHDLEEY